MWLRKLIVLLLGRALGVLEAARIATWAGPSAVELRLEEGALGLLPFLGCSWPGNGLRRRCIIGFPRTLSFLAFSFSFLLLTLRIIG